MHFHNHQKLNIGLPVKRGERFERALHALSSLYGTYYASSNKSVPNIEEMHTSEDYDDDVVLLSTTLIEIDGPDDI